MKDVLDPPKEETPSLPSDPTAERIGVDILGLEHHKNVADCSNCIEFILVSLCQSLLILPNQAAGMLARDNFYLHEACVKGVRGGFEKIVGWY